MSPQTRIDMGCSVMRVWIGEPSRVSQTMKELFSPTPARKRSSGENASFWQTYCMPLSTATGLLFCEFQMITGASGVF